MCSMNEYEQDNVNDTDASAGINDSPSEFAGASNNQESEYHYSRSYGDNIYSDAHYVPEAESTVPPRYYTPPETRAKEPKQHRKKSGAGKWVAGIAICLVCAILGGLGGAALMGKMMNERLSSIEASINEISEKKSVLNTASSIPAAPAVATENSAYSSLAASAIYEMACSQVVGISSEITYQNFFGMNSSAAVSGSGFILTADGYILTNYHVIEDAYQSGTEIKVMTYDGTSYPAAIIGFESDNDIAVLKIEAEGLVPVTIGNSDAMKVGDVVYAVGNPLGELEFSMSTGHVSAKDRQIGEGRNTELINMFQLDAAVNSGNSGGPVYNDKGEVVGIVTAKYASNGVEGLGFAIPINDAAAIADDLINKGYVTGKAYMSLSIRQDYTSMYAQYYGWPMGAMVAEVEEDGAAENAGIQAGDIITKVDDTAVESYNDLKSAVKKYSAGDTAVITLYRAGEEMTVSLTFDEAQPEANEPAQAQQQPQQQMPYGNNGGSYYGQIPDIFGDMFPFNFGLN